MTQLEYDNRMDELNVQKQTELMPLYDKMAEYDEKISCIKKKIAELELQRQDAGHQKAILLIRIQGIRKKYHEQKLTLRGGYQDDRMLNQENN